MNITKYNPIFNIGSLYAGLCMYSKSLEVGDKPKYTDAMFNFVPGSCFELGTSLDMLDRPGNAGIFIDNYAKKLALIIEKIYDTPIGYTLISLTPNMSPISLKEYFNKKILMELKPTSDQIGRCLDDTKSDRWLQEEGKSWLIDQLNMSSDSISYNYTNMLTKIRVLSAFGTIVREMMPYAHENTATLVNKDEATLQSRYNQITTQIRHAEFDHPETRARTEKMPLIDGKPLSSFDGIVAKTIDASIVKLGFGKIWHQEAIDESTPSSSLKSDADTNEPTTVRQKYLATENTFGRQGMLRLGQDITNFERPGLLGESSMRMIPQQFNRLSKQIDDHKFEHGSGLNRWQLTGSYPRASWAHSMPAAGAHSGGTSDVFLALNCLGDNTIFGQENAKLAGLMVSSFMNFGGYHSYIETFPIALAVATNSKFNVNVTAASRSIYQTITNIAQAYLHPDTYSHIAEHLSAYQNTVQDIRVQNASILNQNAPLDKKLDQDEVVPFDVPKPNLTALATHEIAITTEEELLQTLQRAGTIAKVEISTNNTPDIIQARTTTDRYKTSMTSLSEAVQPKISVESDTQNTEDKLFSLK